MINQTTHVDILRYIKRSVNDTPILIQFDSLVYIRGERGHPDLGILGTNVELSGEVLDKV